MSAATSATGPARVAGRARSGQRRKQLDRVADGLLFGVCAFAALLGVVLMLVIAYQVVHGAAPAISAFGL
ncbi:MAG: hypothetical protein ACLGG5_07075, partial [Thermoleophilia bacterium]